MTSPVPEDVMEKARPEHDWFRPSFLKFDCCRKCGIIKRADGKNRPCPGIVNVALRTNATAPVKET